MEGLKGFFKDGVFPLILCVFFFSTITQGFVIPPTLRSLCPSGCKCLTETEAYKQFDGEFDVCKADPCGTAWEKEFQVKKYCYRQKLKIIQVDEPEVLSLCPTGCECLTGPDAEAKYGAGMFKTCKLESCGEGWVKDLKLKKYCYSPIPLSECIDTDGGKNYEVKGSAVGNEDACSPFDVQIIQEYYVEVGDKCVVKSEYHDCNSICENGRCLPPTCDDWIQNQGEEGVDCGGPCPDSCVCPQGCKCVIGADAEEKFGQGKFVSCSNKGCGHEQVNDLKLEKFCYRQMSITDCTDSDGGKVYDVKGTAGGLSDYCSPFDDQQLEEYYVANKDEIHGTCEVKVESHMCEGLCENGRCLPPTCDDLIQNQGEGDIDCGGPCTPCNVCAAANAGNIPSEFTWQLWKGKNWVTEVKNQGACGSCWAFSAAATVEAKYNIEKGEEKNLDLSEQYAVSGGAIDSSCHGGNAVEVFDYMQEKGIPYESLVPYNSGDCMVDDPKGKKSNVCTGTCSNDYGCSNPHVVPNFPMFRWKITHRLDYDVDQNSLKRLIACGGPQSVSSVAWHHAVAVVGWDDNSQICQSQYGSSGCWIIKNSHGVTEEPDWYNYKGAPVWHVDGFAYIPYSGHAYSDLLNDPAWDVSGIHYTG